MKTQALARLKTVRTPVVAASAKEAAAYIQSVFQKVGLDAKCTAKADRFAEDDQAPMSVNCKIKVGKIAGAANFDLYLTVVKGKADIYLDGFFPTAELDTSELNYVAEPQKLNYKSTKQIQANINDIQKVKDKVNKELDETLDFWVRFHKAFVRILDTADKFGGKT